MPKVVDHEERRRQIAEAVFRVIGERGIEAVSLRDVAAEADVSMGSVQHYFSSKAEMLLFALGYMRERVLARLQKQLAKLKDPTRQELLRAAYEAMLPMTTASRQEAIVNVAFFSVATVTPEYAKLLKEGYQRLLEVSRESLRQAQAAGELRKGIDAEHAATVLFFHVQGLIGPILVKAITPAEALHSVDTELTRIFK